MTAGLTAAGNATKAAREAMTATTAGLATPTRENRGRE